MFKKFMRRRKERKAQVDKELVEGLEAAKKRIFLRRLKHGQPKPRGRTKPPIRTNSSGPQ